jgi:hypothetical protein
MRLQVCNRKAGCTSPTQNSSLACNISHPEWPQKYRSVKQELMSHKEERYNASVNFINVNIMSRHTQHKILFQGCKWHLYFEVIIKNSRVRPVYKRRYVLYCFLLDVGGWQVRPSPAASVQSSPVSQSLSLRHSSPCFCPYENKQDPTTAIATFKIRSPEQFFFRLYWVQTDDKKFCFTFPFQEYVIYILYPSKSQPWCPCHRKGNIWKDGEQGSGKHKPRCQASWLRGYDTVWVQLLFTRKVLYWKALPSLYLTTRKLRWPHSKITQPRLNRNTQQNQIQNHKKWTIHTQNLTLKQFTALQQQQQPYPVTPEDGQLGRNM